MRREISSALLVMKRFRRSCCRRSSWYRPSSNLRNAGSWWPGMAMAVACLRVVWTLISCLSEL